MSRITQIGEPFFIDLGYNAVLIGRLPKSRCPSLPSLGYMDFFLIEDNPNHSGVLLITLGYIVHLSQVIRYIITCDKVSDGEGIGEVFSYDEACRGMMHHAPRKTAPGMLLHKT